MTKTALLKKFIENDCSAEEARLAMQYINEDPSLLDELLPKNDWDKIDDKILHPDLSDTMRHRVMTKTVARSGVILKRTLAVAASVAALFFLASLFLEKTTADISEIKVVEQDGPPAITFIENSSSEIKTVNLTDGSVAKLYPGSRLEHPAQFKTDRSIHLFGKAVFEVAKDKVHPFTVYSGAIATTAIGTKFLVENSGGTDQLRVRLYEGKVIVKPVDVSSSIKSVYLTPGQQCFIDLARQRLIVQSVTSQGKTFAKNAVSKPDNIADLPKTVAKLNFEKTPLREVFAQVQKIYSKTIVFDSSNVKDALFTGHFQAGDSPETIIRMIATLNDLTLSHEGELLKIYRDPDTIIAGNSLDEPARPEPDSVLSTFSLKKPSLQNDGPVFNHLPMIKPMQPEGLIEKNGKIYFNNASLKTVINKLKVAGGYNIEFKEEDLTNKYFTGEIELKRSMMNMFKVICRMNGLAVTKSGEKYYVSKFNTKNNGN